MAPPRQAVAGMTNPPPHGHARHEPHEHYVDDNSIADDEDDEEYEDDANDSETSSNYSSVSGDSLPPIQAHGHTYHGSGRLISPNDETEARRMALQHELFKLCLGGDLVDAKLPFGSPPPGAAPAASPDTAAYTVLDVGSGSGLWACDMAQAYPHVNILGIDLTSSLLPKEVPPNLVFEIADAAEPWPPQMYDFIHMRNLAGGGIRDWPGLLRSAYEHLKPGGQIEFTEVRPRFFDVDPEHADLPDLKAGEKPEIGAACLEYEMTFASMCIRQGLDYDPVPRVAGWLSGLGAEGVRERAHWLPVKGWGNDLLTRRKGELLSEMIDSGLENWTMRLFGLNGWDDKATRDLLTRVKQEVHDPKLRSYARLTFITARKPLRNT